MIERGSDIEALLMLCALADPEEARAWLYYRKQTHIRVCPLSSAGNTIAGKNRWSIFPSGATEFMGLPEVPEQYLARRAVVFAADGYKFDPEIRAALEAMFPKEKA